MASEYLKTPFSHVIDGKLHDVTGAKRLDILNPATEEKLADVPIADKATLDLAINAAAKAFPGWRDTPYAKRADAVRAWGKHFATMIPELSKLLSLEQGKAIGMAQYECNSVVPFFENMPDMELKDEILEDSEDRIITKRYVPLGVTIGIVPWNFPVLLMTWKIIPAVLTGNTILIKPSPFTPLSDVRIVESAQKFFPPGVIQIITGDDSLGPWMTEHPGVRKVSFTGSTATGRLVARSCAATLKRMTLELGGNDPCIVLPDVDIATAAPQIFFAMMFNSGQTCICAKRIYVHEKIYDEFNKAVAAAAAASKVGNGLEPDTAFGPIQNKPQFNKVKSFFEDAQRNGDKFITGGQIPENQKGFFAPLTIVDNPKEDSKIVAEEPFGPIVPMLKWSDEEDVIKRANDSEFGLGAMVWGSDKARCDRIARRLEAGNVWVNSVQHLCPHAPFGGAKQSGIGCENGTDGLKGWTQVMSIISSKK